MGNGGAWIRECRCINAILSKTVTQATHKWWADYERVGDCWLTTWLSWCYVTVWWQLVSTFNGLQSGSDDTNRDVPVFRHCIAIWCLVVANDHGYRLTTPWGTFPHHRCTLLGCLSSVRRLIRAVIEKGDHRRCQATYLVSKGLFNLALTLLISLSVSLRPMLSTDPWVYYHITQ